MSANTWTVWSGEMHDQFPTKREAVSYAKELDEADQANGFDGETIEVESPSGATVWANYREAQR